MHDDCDTTADCMWNPTPAQCIDQRFQFLIEFHGVEVCCVVHSNMGVRGQVPAFGSQRTARAWFRGSSCRALALRIIEAKKSRYYRAALDHVATARDCSPRFWPELVITSDFRRCLTERCLARSFRPNTPHPFAYLIGTAGGQESAGHGRSAERSHFIDEVDLKPSMAILQYCHMATLKSDEHYEARARIAKALAHPSRLMILDAVEGREHCVGELTELVGADQSTVSRHLAVLREAGLVIGRKDGGQIWYALRVPCLKGFWSCVETVLKEDVQQRLRATKR